MLRTPGMCFFLYGIARRIFEVSLKFLACLPHAAYVEYRGKTLSSAGTAEDCGSQGTAGQSISKNQAEISVEKCPEI